ncbi:putative kinase-like protein [Lyophyllum shimeji]|uniref:non-specific serine/threonine protein kinase n=1 Tax=Lyophyllum shimeji TaxID=47721 RepID=A0A9P3PZC0_LYOSH|nr:putative kinase-like protein [Lyophyllum shimeji]
MARPAVVFKEADPHAPPRSSNKHVSVDPEGNTLIDLEFIEEPLGVTAEQGHGYLRVEFGDALGPDKRYKVVRKLGWGMNASVWMAFDEKEKRYVAIKALKGYSTDLFKRNVTWELPALQRVASIPPPPGVESTHWPQLLDHFIQPGRDRDGEHLCLVTDVLGGDVKSLQIEVAKKKGLPLPLAKRILLHTLRGLAHMHHCNIVHTDLKHDNIMFDAGSADIAVLIEADPPRCHPPEESWECTVQAAVSQPLPLPSFSEAMTRTYVVSDFGCAQPTTLHTFDEITTCGLRAPEVILQGPWDEKVDIWAFGCLIFEFITGSALFEMKPYPEEGLDETTCHLWQMLCWTQDRITREQVEASKLGTQYFDLPDNPDDPFCNLKGRPRIYNSPFWALLKRYNVLEEADVFATAKFMQRSGVIPNCRCLRKGGNEPGSGQHRPSLNSSTLDTDPS